MQPQMPSPRGLHEAVLHRVLGSDLPAGGVAVELPELRIVAPRYLNVHDRIRHPGCPLQLEPHARRGGGGAREREP